MKYWSYIPEKLQVALIGSALLIIGAATEAAVSWLETLGSASGVS